jgi:hypothetical protein
LETNDTSGTTGGQFLLKFDGKRLGILGTTTTSSGWGSLSSTESSSSLGRGSLWSSEDSSGKLFVVKTTTLINIIDAEEHFQVLSGWNLDTNLLDGFGELVWLDDTIIVQVEVFERFQQDLLLGLGASCFL